MVEEVTIKIHLEIPEEEQQKVKDIAQEINDFELPEEGEFTGEKIEKSSKLDRLKDLDTGAFGKIINFARNPESIITTVLQSSSMLIPLVGIITTVLALPQMINSFVNMLKDRRIIGVFKRDILNEKNPFLTREQQRLRGLGENQVIITQNKGYINKSGGVFTTNTLSQVRANGISDIGIRDKAQGL